MFYKSVFNSLVHHCFLNVKPSICAHLFSLWHPFKVPFSEDHFVNLNSFYFNFILEGSSFFSFSILKVLFHCLLTFFYCWEIASYSNCLWVICLFSLVALISTLWCCTLSLWCVAFCYFIILAFSEPGDCCLSSVLENSQPFYPNNASSQFL